MRVLFPRTGRARANSDLLRDSKVLFYFNINQRKNMITKKRGKGTAVNELSRKREPGDTRFEDNYDRIFRKQKKAGALKVKGGKK